MEKLFVNKTTYTKDTYMDFLQFHEKKFNLTYTLYTLFWGALFLLCIFLAFSDGNRIQGVIVTIVLIVFVGYRFYHPRQVVNKELNSDKISTNNTNTFTFYDKKFQVVNQKGSFDYKYFLLKKVYETSDSFYLYVTRENAFLLSKNTFSYGTSEDFAKFMKKKCKFKYHVS